MDENTVVVSAATAEAALGKLLATISAIDEKAALSCFVPGAVMVAAGRRMAALLPLDRPAMEASFKAPPFDTMMSIEERALAVFAVERRMEAIDPKPMTDLPQLYAEGGVLKALAVKVLDLVAGDEAEVARTLDAVRPGSGYRDRANDLGALHPLLLARRDELARRELMTAAEIDRIGVIAPLLLDPKGGQSEPLKAARLLRNRAYTHFLAAYREIRRHAAFIHDGAPEKLAAYPNIFSHKPGKKKGPPAVTPEEG